MIRGTVSFRTVLFALPLLMASCTQPTAEQKPEPPSPAAA